MLAVQPPWRTAFIPKSSLSSSSSPPRPSIDFSTTKPRNPSLSTPPNPSPLTPPPSTQAPNSPSPKNDGTSNHGKRDKSESISRIQVPRLRYISVSKSSLLHSLSSMLRSQQHPLPAHADADVNGSGDGDGGDAIVSQFTLLSSCLDSIIHAEHKRVLEEMRTDYFSTQSVGSEENADDSGEGGEGEFNSADVRENGSVDDEANADGTMESQENQLPFLNGLDLFWLFGSSLTDLPRNDDGNSCAPGVATATRFQRSFMKLLQDAQFEELSVRDLMLTSALNSDYLLTLPIYVDWKKASESNAIIFRRGYSTEKQKGLLIVEKLDYLQSKILQEIIGLLSKPLVKIGLWIKEAVRSSNGTEDTQAWYKGIQLRLQELFLLQQPYSSETEASDAVDQDLDSDLPIWLAAQKAISRYEGFLSSIGPRSRLLRTFLSRLRLTPSVPEVPSEFDTENTGASEPHLRPVSLSRITLSDIWRPATRKYCGNDVWRMLKVGFSIIFSQSVLQEPAFQELILLYTEEKKDEKTTGIAEIPTLKLKIYENIPMPDLAVIFPNKKLSFRILDTVRLDAATIIGLLAYVINYKFENVLSSPSALLLDVIAVSALIIYLIRVVLGYKQTWDRYQLLVNRTLYEKTLASGFGSIHFLLDASEQQQYKECVLAYAILLKTGEKEEYTCRESLGEECERFLYSTFKEKVQMPVDKAVDMLIRFGLVLESKIDGKHVLQVVPYAVAVGALRGRWDCLLG